MSPKSPLMMLGRYAICDQIGAGGMATVHVGRLMGPVGFTRTVAIKRMHPHLASDPEFVTMFLDEARIAAQVQHTNVVATLDVVTEQGELFLVMEYVEGDSLARMLRAVQKKGVRLPPAVVGTIVSQALHGLHAVHETRGADGRTMGLIHRDVSPDNILVGRDGSTRVLDFGIAKATEFGRKTQAGKIKGKVAYMAPEQIRSGTLDRRLDVYAAGAVLWEALVGRRLIQGDSDVTLIQNVLNLKAVKPSAEVKSLPPEIDDVVLRALSSEPADRFATAREMAMAVEQALGVASPGKVAQLVEGMLGSELDRKAGLVKDAMRRTAEVSSSDLREAQGSVLAAPASPEPRPVTRPFGPLMQVPALEPPPSLEAASSAAPEAPEAPEGDAKRDPPATADPPPGTDIFVSLGPEPAKPATLLGPALELDVTAAQPARPAPRVGSAPLLATLPSESAPPAAAPAPPPAVEIAELEVPARKPAPPPSEPVPAPPPPPPPRADERAADQRSLADRVALERERRAQVMRSRPDPEPAPRGAGLGALRELWVPIALIVLVAAVGAGYMLTKSKGTSGAASASAPVGVADPVACEALRRRVRNGAQPLGLSRDGWVAELWLRPREGQNIDASKIDVLDLKGAGSSRHEVLALSAPSRPTNEGVLVRLGGEVASGAFDVDNAARLSKAADRAFEAVNADAGALYLRCAHLKYHDVGIWFRGKDLPTAATSLLFAMGAFSDAAIIHEANLYAGRSPAQTYFDDLSSSVHRGKVAELAAELERYGATVQSDTQGSVRILYPIDNAGAAVRGSRVVADKAGIEYR